VKRWLREPLLHFVVIGIALFAVYAHVERGRSGIESSTAIQFMSAPRHSTSRSCDQL
jgi:hypothetical protein